MAGAAEVTIREGGRASPSRGRHSRSDQAAGERSGSGPLTLLVGLRIWPEDAISEPGDGGHAERQPAARSQARSRERIAVHEGRESSPVPAVRRGGVRRSASHRTGGPPLAAMAPEGGVAPPRTSDPWHAKRRRPVAVLDACVLMPAGLRDLLLSWRTPSCSGPYGRTRLGRGSAQLGSAPGREARSHRGGRHGVVGRTLGQMANAFPDACATATSGCRWLATWCATRRTGTCLRWRSSRATHLVTDNVDDLPAASVPIA